MSKRIAVLFVFMFMVTISLAATLTLDDLLIKVQDQQKKISDMYAETTTIITSNMSIPGQESEGPQKITQKGKMWTKGDKSRIEMIEPTRQVTINDGKNNPGQNSQSMSMEKAREYFNLSLKSEGGNYIVTGVPKEKNKVFGKMEFVISASDLVPLTVLMYTPQGKLISKTTLQYKKINGQMVPVKNISDVNTPMGSMHIEMEYKNVKVNEGISDSLFVVGK